ncbi:MAG: AAA family ATPase [Coleofasciculus sp. G1-WW12-02]|uniref:AAA family ATPase n=1 Tax=Coleofasciculus sp. G1-WW12-02 TaxID=3068483 RepID=UPI0032F5E903
MRIKEISITDLFGVFNHVIPLNLEEHITIIYGKNGVGKTKLLKLIYEVCNSVCNETPNIPFNQLTLSLDNGEIFKLDGNEIENSPEGHELFFKKIDSISSNINVHFVEDNRLLCSTANDRMQHYNRQSMSRTVYNYSQELAKNIQTKITEYGRLSQSLDRTFPARVVQQKEMPNLTDETLKYKLNRLEEKRSSLSDYGLLTENENTEIKIQGNIDESTKKVLAVYIEDAENKLSLFDDMAKKIDLLKRIINKKFYYKHMKINKNGGFSFVTDDGKFLHPTNLSSGEQHELVLLYELLFKVEPNSLILIDEPELSLHVEWQVQFIKDLQEITQLSNIDVLIATHSPDIIHDRWDLTVELKGPAE